MRSRCKSESNLLGVSQISVVPADVCFATVASAESRTGSKARKRFGNYVLETTLFYYLQEGAIAMNA